jgi:transposase-like protein
MLLQRCKAVSRGTSGMSMRKIHRLTGIALNEVSRVINDFRAKCMEEYL